MNLYLMKDGDVGWTIRHNYIDSCIAYSHPCLYQGEEDFDDINIEDWGRFRESQFVAKLYLSGYDRLPTLLLNRDIKFHYQLTFSDVQDILKMMIAVAKESGCVVQDVNGNLI